MEDDELEEVFDLEDLEFEDQPPIGIIEPDFPLQWVQLPNDEAAVIVAMYDVFGELTNDTGEAVKLICKDRFSRLNAINVTNELISKKVKFQS